MRRTLLATLALCLVLATGAGPASAAQTTTLPEAGLSFDQYPALKDVYKDYFLVGTIDRFDLSVRREMIAYNFNAITNENLMKPEWMQRTRGEFIFSGARFIHSQARDLMPGVKIIGHTLAWHQQTPQWMLDVPNYDRTVALENLTAHIEGVLGEFGADLYSVDVVNEAFKDDIANPNDWRNALRSDRGWYLALGPEWVELAFVAAAKVIDENGWDCKLYYNDYNTEVPSKATAIHEMVREINERHAGERPKGKELIEGVGMQAHLNSETDMDSVEASVRLFTDLPGVSISFTEIDIGYPVNGSLTDEQAVAQAEQYAKLFVILKKYAAGRAGTSGNPQVIERVTFWGVDDAASWRSARWPLPWRSPSKDQIVAKEALLGVLWPEEYLGIPPVTKGVPSGGLDIGITHIAAAAAVLFALTGSGVFAVLESRKRK
uniref:Beta-xylanase n=1 Tax=uncultured bacterium contig00005 TaxID=1181497 RepID=A0A806KI72_9BACT|nr:endo-1,4-beta-xylanase A precursor [uncultured bacterium contig00005]